VVVSDDCSHEKTTTSNLSQHGVSAEVTVCSMCGTSLDYRPLKPVKDVPLVEGTEVAEIEARIQQEAKAAKAREIGLVAEILEESGVTEALPDEPTGPAAATAPAPAPQRDLEVDGPVYCSKHGGKLEPCDHGAGKAHHCQHSKWGALRTFNSPCACYECHRWPSAPKA
jgi:hypothetical protein